MCENNKKVSIISPIFNGEKHLDYFLKSILEQTYKNIELILIDDGSIDNTKKILEKSKIDFENKGITTKIIYKENGGPASAINEGFKEMTGDYVKWMDSDDFLDKYCIEKEVKCLEENNDIDFVICDSEYVNFNDFSTIKYFSREVKNNKDEYFLDILKGKHNYSIGRGTVLVKKESLKKAIPLLSIYDGGNKCGQNYQLMLPLTYFCKWKYLREPLYKRVVRKDSFSNNKYDYDAEVLKWEGYKSILNNTLERMHIKNLNYYKKIANTRILKELFYISLANKKINDMNLYFFQLIKNKYMNIDILKKFVRRNLKETLRKMYKQLCKN